MGRILLIGTFGTFVALSALVDSACAANPNVPSYSPYAIMAYDVAPAPQPVEPARREPVRRERRAAHLEDSNNDFVPQPAANAWSGPGYSPYASMIH
jgi:hypothetical protein